MPKEKRGRGRPPINKMPDTPENIAKACMQGPPKKDWEYLSRWTDNPFGPVNKTPEERERIARRDAEIEAVGEKLRRERQERGQG